MASADTASAYGMGDDAKPKESPRTVDRVSIEVAHNGGYIVECSYKTPKSRPSDKPAPYVGPSRKVFTDFDSLSAFLKTALGGGTQDQSESESPAEDDAEGDVEE